MINKLLIGVSFHFAHQRLEYLKKVTSQFESLSIHTKAFVVTNTKDKDEKNIIKENWVRGSSTGTMRPKI